MNVLIIGGGASGMNLIAAFDGSAGGTRYTMEYAMRRGLTIVDLSISSE